MNNNDTWYTSTGVIICALIFFWPVGLFLLYLRLKSTGKYKSFTNIMNGLGIILVLMAVLAITSGMEESDYASTLAISIILFLIPGIILIINAYKRRKKLKTFNRYLNYISKNGKTDINMIATKIGVEKSKATETILEMLDKNIVSGYIDESDFLILDGYIEPTVNTNSNYTKNYNAPKSIVIKCKECGAKNTITVGTTKECEYCGTILQG